MFFFQTKNEQRSVFAENGDDGEARKTQHFRGFFRFFFLLCRINIIAIQNGGVKKKKGPE